MAKTKCHSCNVEKENNPTSDMPDGWTWELVGNVNRYEAHLNYLCDNCKEKE